MQTFGCPTVSGDTGDGAYDLDLGLLDDAEFGAELLDFLPDMAEEIIDPEPEVFTAFPDSMTAVLTLSGANSTHVLRYSDGIDKDVGERVNYLICKDEEFKSMGLDDDLFHRLADERLSHEERVSEFIMGLERSWAIGKKFEGSQRIYYLPESAKRLDAEFMYYIEGIDVMNSIAGTSKDSLDQGAWQRALLVSDLERDALIGAHMRRDSSTIAKFLQFYLKKQGSAPHWSLFTNPRDGSVHVHFNQSPRLYSRVDEIAVGTQSCQEPDILLEDDTVIQTQGQANVYGNMSVTSSPITSSAVSDTDELHTTSSECSSSSEESEAEEDEEDEKSDSPGDRAPLGADLPDRGRHICRATGCAKIYRWPDYFCGDHGGGRCQYQHWVEGAERCTRFHQSRNSRGELLCGHHSRQTNARYGEEKRKPKHKANKASKVKKGVNKTSKKSKGCSHKHS